MSSLSLKYLTCLQLLKSESCLQLSVLGKLPSLKNLRVYNMINVKCTYEECYDGWVIFMALEFITVESTKPNKVIKGG